MPRLLNVVPKKPIGGLLDPRFVYVPADFTDIRKTFERARAAQPLVAQPKKAHDEAR